MNNELDNELFGNLVFSGKEDEVKKMIDFGVDLDRIGSKGLTPLIMAIEGDQPRILELLLSYGANPNQQSGLDGFTPLHWAVDYAVDGMIQNNKNKPFPEPLECIRILLDYGADVKIKNNSGETVFDFPMPKEVLDKLDAK